MNTTALCPDCDALLSVAPSSYPIASCKCGFLGTPYFITEQEAKELGEPSGIPSRSRTRDNMREMVRQEIADALVSMAAALRKQG